MAQAIGTLYEVVNVPMRLYYASDRANVKNALQSGWVTKAGSYKIINHVVGSDGVDLYAIQDNPYGTWYTIGWVRDDDNVQGVRFYNIPPQISTNDANYKVSLEGTKGIAYKYTAKIGTTVIDEEEATLTSATTVKTFTLTSTVKNLIYKALGNNNTGVMDISVVSTHNGKTIRTSTSSITVVIPAENGPEFTTNPMVAIVGAIDGLAYKDISSVRVSVPTSSISLKDGATLKTRRFQIGSHSHTTSTADNYTSPVIGSVGSVPVKVTVTDSRNRSTTFETSITFNETQKINIDSFTAIRSGKTGIKITANGRYMNQIDGTPEYIITKSVRGANAWTGVATGTATVANGRYSISITQTSGFTATSAYDLRLVVSGTSTSATGNSVVGTEAVPISFGKHGSGVGVMFDNSNTASLQVGSGGIHSEGEAYLSGSNKAWHQGNDGSDSGLDADLLDGKHASAFALAGHTHTDPASSVYFTTGGSGFDRWIRFSTGETIAWGRHSGSASTGTFSFSRTFTEPPLVTLNASIATNNPGFNLTGIGTTDFSIRVVNSVTGAAWASGGYMVHYHAMGMS